MNSGAISNQAGQGSNGAEHENDPAVIEKLLNNKGATWAMVGLTNNPNRPAPNVSLYVKEGLGMNIIPVNPRNESVHGESAYRRLSGIEKPIDVVDIFVNASQAEDLVQQAIDAGAKAVWLQVGVRSEKAAQMAKDAGLDVVMDTCPSIEGRIRGLGMPT